MVKLKPTSMATLSLLLSPPPLLLLLRLLLISIAITSVRCFDRYETKLLSLQNVQWQVQSGTTTTTTTTTTPSPSSSSSTTSCLSQKSRSEKGSIVLELKHKDSCSSKTLMEWNKEQKKRLVLDDLHVKNLQFRLRNTRNNSINNMKDVSEMPLTSGLQLQTLNYIVTVQVGGKKMTLIADTGSDLTWIQCQPCKYCYSQKDPLYNPSNSSSYQRIPCKSTACQSLQFATGNSGVCSSSTPSSCNYVVNYGDGSYTRGELGRETLLLGTTQVKDFIFGCGRNNKGLFGGASGIMGLGRSDLSLVSQTKSLFGGVFSYCLPSTQHGASGSLVLGGNSSLYKNSTPITYTTMVQNPLLPTFYFLNLTGITIGGARLPDSGFGKRGFLIDSGTVITRLPSTIYNAFKKEFMKKFLGFPSAPGYSILDTCFNLTGYKEVNIPVVKLHYDGDADMDIDITGIFYFVKSDASQVCLALASLSFDDEIGIIGNYQQRNQRVIYDTKEFKLGFAGESCTSI